MSTVITAPKSGQLIIDPARVWSYETPLEPVPEGVTLDPRVVQINGMYFQARSDCSYKVSPYKLLDEIERYKTFTAAFRKENPLLNEANLYRNVIQQDLWFFVYFMMKNPLANHPFIMKCCREIEAEKNDTLETWARDHLKTTIISVGKTCLDVLNNPEERIAIFSAVRPLAVKIQNLIKKLFETPFLVKCFPDILYIDPYKEADKWSEAPEGGLIVKRKGLYKEPTISSWGLVEGMPTGDHYTKLRYDDIVNQDLLSPEMMSKVCENFDMTVNIGSSFGHVQRTVVGTFYRHDDPLVYIRDLQDPVTGEKIFQHRIKAATEDGTFSGKSVFLPERSLAKKRSGKKFFFYCQQLLDPTPRGQEKLNPDHLIPVTRQEIRDLEAKDGRMLYKFMMIDGAGDEGRRQDREADAWGMAVVGVRPLRDELGFSDIYILDLRIEAMDLIQAKDAAVEMYCRNGRILKLGIEKVGMSSTEIHIKNALKAKRRFVSVEAGSLEILRPGGRSKESRIENAWSAPLKNGKIHYLNTIPAAHIERLKLEMQKFPAWKNDGLDGISYVYDLIKTYNFGKEHEEEAEKPDPYAEAFRRARESRRGGWISV